MDGASGTALEWALALLRAPGERHRLRQRPLPPGVTDLLAVIANVAPETANAALLQSGESADVLREAARFYAREILFHGEADAYRTLGVAADATAEQIKANHRLLQIWLHPDRQHAGDDSIFAARVNKAWNQLRSEDRRRAYDAERAAAANLAPAPAEIRPGAQPLPVAVWHPQPVAPAAFTRKRHRALVAGLIGICLLLGWLVLRQSLREPEPWGFDIVDAAPPAADERAQARVLHPGDEPAAPPRQAVVETAVPLPELPPVLELPPAPLPLDEDGPLTAAIPVAQPPPASIPQAEVVRTVSATRSPPARSAPPHPASPPPRPALPVVAAAPPPPATAASAAPAAVSAATAAASAAASAPPTARQDSLFGRLRQAFGQRAPANDGPELGVEGDVEFARIQQARQVGQQLLRYLASNNRTPPPIWASAAALDRAEDLRRDLRQRGATRLGAPQWRIGQTHGALRSAYQAGGVSQGSVAAALVWRDDRWLVTSVALEAGP